MGQAKLHDDAEILHEFAIRAAINLVHRAKQSQPMTP
jgi:hypothetical protein